MPAEREIRADFDRETIVVYQAYAPAIADPAIAAQRFVPPFSLHRMTWIKPSFLWLMHRSGWARKKGQERVLAVRIKRSGWEQALALGVLTSHEPGAFASAKDWADAFAQATVQVQWDPERSLRGAGLAYDSIQVGLSRQVIRDYVESWTVGITDLTPRARKIHDLLQAGRADQAKRQLPPERPYPVSAAIARRLSMGA